jgi:putative NADPH-quinone reductase
MKVLLVRGNPRPIGFTQQLTDLFLQGLRETGAQVTDVRLADRSLFPCSGCFHCWLVTPGQCVHGDDMGDLLEAIQRSDVIVCATPVYYFSMSALLKVFFERTFPLSQQGMTTSKRGEPRNRIRYPDTWKHKKLITLITGALRNPAAYRPLLDTFEWIADSLDLELSGQLLRPESYLLDYTLSKPKTIKRIKAAFVEAGRQAGTTGRLSPETLETARLPISADEAHFRIYSEIYWNHAQELGIDGTIPAQVCERVAFDVRILMREMVRSFDPRAAAGTRTLLQFEFPDQNLHFQIRIEDGHCTLHEGNGPTPNLVVRGRARAWAALFTRQLDARDALKNRDLVLEGDKSLFARLERWFPPASA